MIGFGLNKPKQEDRDRSMRMSVILVLIVMAAITAPSGGSGRHALAQSAANVSATTCELAGSQAAAIDQSLAGSPLAEGVPAGLALSVLADRPAEQWPAFADSLVMTIRRLNLAPGAVTDIRRTQGPLLFYVESGNVGLSINGRMQPQSPGAAALVETGQHYLLRNDPNEPATVLRLALVPPDEETTVNRGGVAQVIDAGQEIAMSPGAVESQMLVRADVPALSGTTRLFLACLAWVDASADPGEASHPGPVGFLVLDGQLLVGETGVLSAGDCTFFSPQAPRRLRAGDPSPTVLMFGVLPGGERLWNPAGVSDPVSPSDRPMFECGIHAAPDETPDAASMVPRHPQLLVRA